MCPWRHMRAFLRFVPVPISMAILLTACGSPSEVITDPGGVGVAQASVVLPDAKGVPDYGAVGLDSGTLVPVPAGSAEAPALLPAPVVSVPSNRAAADSQSDYNSESQFESQFESEFDFKSADAPTVRAAGPKTFADSGTHYANPNHTRTNTTKSAPKNTKLIGQKIVAGESRTIVSGLQGTGTVDLFFSRDAGSAAPNLPTYVSSICSGRPVYSGAYNTTGSNQHRIATYTGKDCKVKVLVNHPSPKWSGKYNAVYVSHSVNASETKGKTVTEATWQSRPVSGVGRFTLDAAPGTKGTVDLKLTACSSKGGTSDRSRKFACGNKVQKNVGSTFQVTVSDAKGELYSAAKTIGYREHHSMLHIKMPRPVAGSLTITVKHISGSAILVHGPNTRYIG